MSSHHRASGFESSEIGTLFCDLCKAKLNSREEFKEHMRIKHNIPT